MASATFERRMDEARGEWAIAEKVLSARKSDGEFFSHVTHIYGPPGTGKSHLAYNAAPERMGDRGFVACTLNSELSSFDLIGHFVNKGGDTTWYDEAATRAYRGGSRFVVNEISHAASDVAEAFYPILESVMTSHLLLSSGESLRPAEGFHVVLTDNRPPEDLPEAIQDRINAKVRVTMPHPDALATLPEDLREPCLDAILLEDPDRRTGFRAWATFAEARELFPLREAACMSFGHIRGPGLAEALALVG